MRCVAYVGAGVGVGFGLARIGLLVAPDVGLVVGPWLIIDLLIAAITLVFPFVVTWVWNTPTRGMPYLAPHSARAGGVLASVAVGLIAGTLSITG